MDEHTIAMFRRFQRVLLTLAREWRDPALAAGPIPPNAMGVGTVPAP
jgi:hypothetical protein